MTNEFLVERSIIFSWPKLILSTCLAAISLIATGQNITLPPYGENQKAGVTQWINTVKVEINYSSPDVHAPSGQDRRGHIWGDLVPYGMVDLGLGLSKSSPWRVGANESTTISFSDDVLINGNKLAAGRYALFLIPEKDKPWIWVFNRKDYAWGSIHYNESQDVLRVQAQPVNSSYSEWLSFNFEERLPTSTVASLMWEEKKVSFKIEVPDRVSNYLEVIRKELKGEKGLDHLNWMAAAQFCIQEKTNLDEALTWADWAINAPAIGVENVLTLQTKAEVLSALGSKEEAEKLYRKALQTGNGTALDIYTCGRSLITSGNLPLAMEFFNLNEKRYPDEVFYVSLGLARGYTALKDKEKAIKYWEKVLKNVPNSRKDSLPIYEAALKRVKTMP